MISNPGGREPIIAEMAKRRKRRNEWGAAEWIDAPQGATLKGRIEWQRVIRGTRITKQPRLRFEPSPKLWRFKLEGDVDTPSLGSDWWQFAILAFGRRRSVKVKPIRRVKSPLTSYVAMTPSKRGYKVRRQQSSARASGQAARPSRPRPTEPWDWTKRPWWDDG
jgi:hypothetical protein